MAIDSIDPGDRRLREMADVVRRHFGSGHAVTCYAMDKAGIRTEPVQGASEEPHVEQRTDAELADAAGLDRPTPLTHEHPDRL